MNRTLELAAMISLATYSQNPTVAGFEITPFTERNITGFFAVQGEALWIAFRGTDDRQDWVNNLGVAKDRMPLGAVHRGFNQAATLIWPQILAEVCRKSWANIMATGHSLGGGVGEIIAGRLAQNGIRYVSFFSFGKPRVGDREWAKSLERVLGDRIIRVFRAGDLVPHVPTALRFQHPLGQEIYFNHQGISVQPTVWHRMGGAVGALSQMDPLMILNRHDMSAYLDDVRGLG